MWIGPSSEMVRGDTDNDLLWNWLQGLYDTGYLWNPGLVPILRTPSFTRDGQLQRNEPRHGYRARDNAPTQNRDILTYPWNTPFLIEGAAFPHSNGRYVYDIADLTHASPTPQPSAMAELSGMMGNISLAASKAEAAPS